MKTTEERIKEAFPELVPSGEYDYLEELIGMLRVTRGQRDENHRYWRKAVEDRDRLQDFHDSQIAKLQERVEKLEKARD